MKANWKGLVFLGKKAFAENKPAIFFASGVVCLASCAVLTAKAAPKAERKMDQIDREERSQVPEAETEEELEENRKEFQKRKAIRILKEVAPIYAPPFVAGVASVVSFGLSNRQLSKEAAGAVAACTIAEKALGAYQDNVISELGEEVHDKIMKAVVDEVPPDILEESAKDEPVTANLFGHDQNEKLYYDHVTGRMFYSTDEKIKDAESTVNKLLIDTGMATVNDFYSALLLDCDSVLGDAVGWRIEDPHARNMDVIFGSRLDREGNVPMITIGYRTCAVNLRELERR